MMNKSLTIEEMIKNFINWCESDVDYKEDDNIDYVEMNAYDDIVHFKDGTMKVNYHCCD